MDNAPEKELNENPATEPVQVSSLAEAALESSEEIQKAAPAKRGRKPKPRDADGNIIPDAVSGASTKPAQKAPEKKKIDTPALDPKFLEPIVNFPFQMVAMKTGLQFWELSEKEKEQNAILLEKCMARYLPQLQSEHAELVGLSIGLGMAAVSRYMLTKQYLQGMAAQSANQNTQRDNGSEQVSPEKEILPGSDKKPGKKQDTPKHPKNVVVGPSDKPGNALSSILDVGTQN